MADDSGSSVPISPPSPDPTKLTSEAVDRAVTMLKDLFGAKQGELERAIIRLDKAIDARPREISDADDRLMKLVDQKFATVAEKFNGIEDRFQLNDLALNAALSAAKEAVGKQQESSKIATDKAEASSAKQMDQVREIVNTSIGGLNDKIDLGGNRTTTLESQVTGLLQTVAQLRAVVPAPPPNGSSTPIGLWVVAGFGVLLLVVILIFEIMGRVPVGLIK